MWPRGPVASEGGFQSTTGLTLGCVGVGCGCGCFRRCRDCDFYVELEGEFQSETGPMPGCGGLVDVGGDVGVDVDVVDSVCIFLRGIRGQVLVYNCVDGEMLELSADVDANVGVGVDVDVGDDVYVVVDVSVLLCGIRGQPTCCGTGVTVISLPTCCGAGLAVSSLPSQPLWSREAICSSFVVVRPAFFAVSCVPVERGNPAGQTAVADS